MQFTAEKKHFTLAPGILSPGHYLCISVRCRMICSSIRIISSEKKKTHEENKTKSNNSNKIQPPTKGELCYLSTGTENSFGNPEFRAQTCSEITASKITKANQNLCFPLIETANCFWGKGIHANLKLFFTVPRWPACFTLTSCITEIPHLLCRDSGGVCQTQRPPFDKAIASCL